MLKHTQNICGLWALSLNDDISSISDFIQLRQVVSTGSRRSEITTKKSLKGIKANQNVSPNFTKHLLDNFNLLDPGVHLKAIHTAESYRFV